MTAITRINRLERNLIINGNFSHWQRGVTFSGSPLSQYTADRWVAASNAGNTSMSREFDVPNDLSDYSIKWKMNVASSLVAGTFMNIDQKIEGQFIKHITRKAGSKITVGVWLKCSKAGVRNITLRSYPGLSWVNNRSYVSKVTIAQADTWEFHRVVIEFDGVGQWDSGNTTGLYFTIPMRGGSDFQIAADQWVPASSGEFCSADLVQLNDLDDYLMVSQVQILEGDIDLDGSTFVYACEGNDWSLCQRYYMVSGTFRQRNYAASTTFVYIQWPYPTTMRDTPGLVTVPTGAYEFVDENGLNVYQSTASLSVYTVSNIKVDAEL